MYTTNRGSLQANSAFDVRGGSHGDRSSPACCKLMDRAVLVSSLFVRPTAHWCARSPLKAMKAAAAHGSPTVKAIIPRTFDGPMGGDEKGRPRRRLHECTALGGSSGKWAEGRGFEETGKACCRASEGGGHARARRHRAAPGRWGSVVAVALLALASIGGEKEDGVQPVECLRAVASYTVELKGVMDSVREKRSKSVPKNCSRFFFPG